MIKESMGQRLHRLRKSSGFSLMELGRLARVSDNTIYHLEHDLHIAKVDTAIQIARVFGVTLDYLCCLTDEDKSLL